MLSALKAVIQCQNQGTKETKSYEKRLTIHDVKSFGKVNDDCSCMWEGRVKLAELLKIVEATKVMTNTTAWYEAILISM